MGKINNKDFIRQISKKTGYTQNDIKAVINAVSDIVIDNLSDGNATTVFTGLIIEPRDVAATDKRNPRDGSVIHVPAHKAPKAKFGAKIKEAIR